jgi:preprotein translocase subunit SecB
MTDDDNSDAPAAEGATGTEGEATGAAAAPGEATQEEVAQLSLMAQYVKDLSFENPNAPNSFQEKESPKIDVSIDVRARRVGDEHYEVELKFAVKASHSETTAFVAELLYGGLFGIRNVPEEHLEALCLIECPRLLFPFARRILADATRDGGFPPLMLDPIDFVALYQQRSKANGEGKSEGEGSALSAEAKPAPSGNGSDKAT